MNFEDAGHEAAYLKARIRYDRLLRANPTNWDHKIYQNAVNEFFVLFLIFMGFLALVSYVGLVGFLLYFFSTIIGCGAILGALLWIVTLVELIRDTYQILSKWVTSKQDHGGNY